MIAQAPHSSILAKEQEGSSSFPATPNPSVAERRFKVFSILWAVASLFHLAHSSIFDTQVNLALLTLAALFVIFRPSMAGFVILIILQLFDAVFRMPFTTNHWIFTAFVNLTILHSLLYLIIRNRTFHVTEGNLLNTFGPLVKIELIILYFFAVFHKLNDGFFSPLTSCAKELLLAQHLDNFIPLTASVFSMNAYFTVLVELSIPVLLCFRKTRNLAVLTGLFFHSVLSYSSYNAFYDFSAMVFAVYFLFISPCFAYSLYEAASSLKSSKDSFLKNYHYGKLLIAGLVLLLLLGILYLMNKRMDTPQSVHLYFFWAVYSVIFIILFLKYMFSRKRNQQADQGVFRFAHWSLLIFPAIHFINGMLPYLGLKTENSYAMFSNLRTEGGKSNHFIIPAGVQVFDFQKDVVQIISSSDEGLQKLAKENKALVLFEFRNYVHERKPDKVDYLLNGEKFTFEKSQSGSFQALGSNPYVLRKLMKFRPFTIDEPQPCAH